MLRISKIFLYDEPKVPEIRINDLSKFLEKIVGVKVEVRKNILTHFKADRKTAYELASYRIFNLFTPFERHNPTQEEVSFEESSFSNHTNQSNIILYDGFELQNLLKDMIPENESEIEKLHIVFTSKFTCSYDHSDYRYHGRVIICSNPAIISTTGMIEAPAKPREFYFGLHKHMVEGLNLEVLKSQFRGKFLDYNDGRLDRVARAYSLQAIFYHLTSNPFCNSPGCLLFNAHWQEEVLDSQIRRGVLCNKHRKMLEEIQNHE